MLTGARLRCGWTAPSASWFPRFGPHAISRPRPSSEREFAWREDRASRRPERSVVDCARSEFRSPCLWFVTALCLTGFACGDSSTSTQAVAVTSTILVGVNPIGIAVDTTSHTVYVANFYDKSVSVIDGATKTLSNTLPIPDIPRAIAVDPALHTVYVASNDDNFDGHLLLVDEITSAVTGTGPLLTGTGKGK